MTRTKIKVTNFYIIYELDPSLFPFLVETLELGVGWKT
jgi:hypothetical protein